MGEDASLDDFLGGESSEQSAAAETQESAGETAAGAVESAGETAADAVESADETTPAGETKSTDTDEPETDATDDEPAADTDEAEADIEPARTTYAWDGVGANCDDCGETVERRWQQDGGLVCIECKDWERP